MRSEKESSSGRGMIAMQTQERVNSGSSSSIDNMDGTTSPCQKKARTTAAQQNKEERSIIVKHRRCVLPKKEGAAAEVAVVDVTSKGDPATFAKLSPFEPYVCEEDGMTAYFEVPLGTACGDRSYTVEGIWQGLKVMEGGGIDRSKFRIANRKNIKRSSRKCSKVLGHYAGEGKPLLGYVEARNQIYIPAYRKMLMEHPKAKEQMEALYAMHLEKDLVLLDFCTNEDPNVEKPLAHASLIKARLHEMFAERNARAE